MLLPRYIFGAFRCVAVECKMSFARVSGLYTKEHDTKHAQRFELSRSNLGSTFAVYGIDILFGIHRFAIGSSTFTMKKAESCNPMMQLVHSCISTISLTEQVCNITACSPRRAAARKPKVKWSSRGYIGSLSGVIGVAPLVVKRAYATCNVITAVHSIAMNACLQVLAR